MTDQDDRELRERFGALRSRDAGRAPAFGDVWARAGAATRTQRPRATSVVPLAAAAVVVLVAGATLAFLATSTRRVPPGPSVTEWVAPTAPLMESPARALFATPSVTKSVIDRFIPPATIFKGD